MRRDFCRPAAGGATEIVATPGPGLPMPDACRSLRPSRAFRSLESRLRFAIHGSAGRLRRLLRHGQPLPEHRRVVKDERRRRRGRRMLEERTRRDLCRPVAEFSTPAQASRQPIAPLASRILRFVGQTVKKCAGLAILAGRIFLDMLLERFSPVCHRSLNALEVFVLQAPP